MSTFDKKKLRMLSPDAEDWNDLLEAGWRNQENMLEGVLLYPKRGISAEKIEEEVLDFIEDREAVGHGSIEIMAVTKRGKDWAVAYRIESWYNHFDLNEEYD